MTMLQRILVPLDGSHLAETILPETMNLAQSCGAELLLLRVAFAHVFPGMDAIEEEVRVIRTAEEYVAEVAARFAGNGVPVRTAVRYGKPIEEILDHIVANGVDLVAMSTHGRGGLRHLVMGSVAEGVVHKADVPVLLFRSGAKQREFGLPVEARLRL
jgi:nucleotide-binding universal stress UspA family protein